MEPQKTLNNQSNLEGEKKRHQKTKLGISHSLTSDYTTKLQKSKHHGTGTKADT